MAAIVAVVEGAWQSGPLRDQPLGFAISLLEALADKTIEAMSEDPAHAQQRCGAGLAAVWRLFGVPHGAAATEGVHSPDARPAVAGAPEQGTRRCSYARMKDDHDDRTDSHGTERSGQHGEHHECGRAHGRPRG
jgi:hypothetical protein